jgi:flagellin-specific chaperone FliS
LIKSLFKDSGWTINLIDIFNALNPFLLSSSKQLSPFSKNIQKILEYTSKSIILVEDENTPEEISNYLKLTNI